MTTPRNHHQHLKSIDTQLLKLLRERNCLTDVGPEFSRAEELIGLLEARSRQAPSQTGRRRMPQSTENPRTVLIVGGEGQMARCYGRAFAASGHHVRSLDVGDWDRTEALVAGVDAVIVAVPIRVTEQAIAQLGPHLTPDTLLADFTSHKSVPLRAMLKVHRGPVVGLHPMHGPDVRTLSKQLMIACPGRQPEASQWLLEQFGQWGLRVQELDPAHHDRIMDQVQGLRHFVALLHGSFMRASALVPADILELSSPIYRAELMMTGRIFAQNAELYADIVFANANRRRLLLDFLAHHDQLAALVREDDKAGFIREFEAIGEFFGDFTDQARLESGYLIDQLADRFVE